MKEPNSREASDSSKELERLEDASTTFYKAPIDLQGLVGAVTRPVSGVVDFASTTMGTVKTVAGGAKEIGPLRPPRIIRSDKIIRPYAKEEAVGYKIFKVGQSFESSNYFSASTRYCSSFLF